RPCQEHGGARAGDGAPLDPALDRARRAGRHEGRAPLRPRHLDDVPRRDLAAGIRHRDAPGAPDRGLAALAARRVADPDRRVRLHLAQRPRRPSRRPARPQAADGAVSTIALKLRFVRSGSGRVGVAGSLLILALVLFGPFFAPHDPAAIAGIPLQRPNGAFVLGTDALGRDVLSRILWGGRSIVSLSLLATVLAYLVGTAIGLVAGYSRSM